MEKFLLFFALILVSVNSANAMDPEISLCDLSKSCKKVCDLKQLGLYSDKDKKHQALALDCADDLSKKTEETPRQ